ncbi:MAG TPA: hypothetical protein DCL43_01375, partial [Chitinophagaceae bacterium]|nr:hypothetical protein [Chitinophagaceae bacterium]
MQNAIFSYNYISNVGTTMFYVFDIDHYCWLVFVSAGSYDPMGQWTIDKHEFYVGAHKKRFDTWPKQPEEIIIHTYYAFRDQKLIDDKVLVVGISMDLRKYNR